MTYHTCPDCRANLDPGERCDCKDKAVREEAIRDVSGMPPLPLREWGMIKAFN